MKQTIPADPKVSLGKLVAGYVEGEEFRPAAGVGGSIRFDERGNNVSTHVADGIGGNDLPHPVEIAARRIKNRPYCVFIKDNRQMPPKIGCVVEG
jgi:hypothetical protein